MDTNCFFPKAFRRLMNKAGALAESGLLCAFTC